MFEQTHKLISALFGSGVLRNRDVVAALTDFARSLDDLDYRSRMLGELSLRLAETGEFDKAEELARLIENAEKSEFLRRIAEIEGVSHADRALRLFFEARDSACLHRFPTQRALALTEIAESLEVAGRYAEASDTWDLAVQFALAGQHSGGTDGPEAGGVLLKAVEAFCKSGRTDAARSLANAIAFGSLRESAFHAIAKSARA